MKYVLKHTKPYIWLLCVCIILIGLQTYTNLLLPDLMSDMVNVGIQEYSNEILLSQNSDLITSLKAEQMSYIYSTGLKMILVAVLFGVITMAVRTLSSFVGYSISRDIRKSVFSKIESFSGEDVDKFSTASLITRTTNDVQQMQMLFSMGIRVMFYAPFMAIGGVVMAVSKAPSLVWINALSAIVIIMFVITMQVIALPKFKKIQEIIDKINLVARENLSGIMVVRAFSTQKYEEERFDKVNADFKATNQFINRLMSLMSPTLAFIQAGIPILIIWISAPVIAKSELLVGDMLAFIQYSGNIISAFMMLTSMFNIIPRATVSIKRIDEVLKKENSIQEIESPIVIKKTVSNIEFKNVNFKYPESEDNILNNISFKLEKGSTTAIIGSTGSGKTTLLNLLLRFYDATSGEILINDIDIKNIELKNLRDLMGYVPQKSILFQGSLKTNMLAGKKDATDDEIYKALQIAQMESFVNQKEEGLDFYISQGGANVSGGQRQRLAIARALIRKSPILVFDDSFSALDFKTDTNLRRAIYENYKNPTVIIIGQRVSSVMNSDQIIVMDKGEIKGIGKHKDLLNTCNEYKEIAHSQLSVEEV